MKWDPPIFARLEVNQCSKYRSNFIVHVLLQEVDVTKRTRPYDYHCNLCTVHQRTVVYGRGSSWRKCHYSTPLTTPWRPISSHLCFKADETPSRVLQCNRGSIMVNYDHPYKTTAEYGLCIVASRVLRNVLDHSSQAGLLDVIFYTRCISLIHSDWFNFQYPV